MAQFSQKQSKLKRVGGQRRRFLHIGRKTSAAIGTQFFHALVDHLGPALEADCLYIGEFSGGQVERVRTLAAWANNKSVEDFEFPLVGSPDAEVAVGNPCVFSRGVSNLFSTDRRLMDLHAEAFVGIALRNAEGLPAGVIAAIYRSPVDEDVQFVQDMLAMFAPRASAELNRKHAEDVLQESEQRHRAFVMQNPDAMWRIEFGKLIATDLPEEQQLEDIRRYGYVAECNDSLARLVGLDRAEQLIGVGVGELVPQAAAAMQNATRLLIRSGYRFMTVETTPVDQAGNRRHVLRSQWGIVENGFLERIWGTTRDITELKRYQMELVTAERRLTELLEAVHLLAIMLDREGAISFCNDYLLKLTGWRAEEIAGKNWFDVMIPPGEREKQRAEFASQSRAANHFTGTLLTRDGRRCLIDWDSVVLRNIDGGIAGSASVGRDMTDYRSLQAQFLHAQKLEGIGKLAGGVAHDFNNLLTIIRGYSSHLLQQTDVANPAYVSLMEIKKAAEKGAALTNQLLAFSRRQSLQPQLLNLNAVIAEDERMLRRLIGEQIELVTDLDPSLWFVRADAGHIHQMILNLALNARDAMPQGGKLIITLANVTIGEERPSRLSEVEPGPYVHLIVADTGTGMSQDAQAHLFEPFFTTKEPAKGTGLGLSTVYGIIRQNGGHIVVETEQGKGTTFEIFLPRVQAPAATSTEAPAEPEARGGTETILLVDDQPEVQSMLGAFLSNLGYKVLQAGRGDQALRLIKRHSGPLHLVVTDMVMPGMPGDQLAKSVREIHPEAGVIYISGYEDPERITQTSLGPRTLYLRKSFTPETLATKVREVLDQK